MSVGRILRFDELRGYGFIVQSDGGEDVFFHANDFGDQRHLVRQDARVEFEVEESDRGLKVASVRIIDSPARVRSERHTTNGNGVASAAGSGDDDGMCDVLTASEFIAEITEVLIKHASSMSGAQIAQVREQLVVHARSHGWVEA